MVYRWGVIGAGRFAENVFVPALLQCQGSKLAAVMARDKKKAEAFAGKYKIPRFYDSATDLCKDSEVDVVYISSPTFLHCEHTALAARYGKHVFCEKPMAVTPEECDRMIDACEKNRVTLMVGHNMRYHKVHQSLREMVSSGQVGRVGIARAEIITSFQKNQGARFTTDQFRLNRGLGGGGVLFDMGIHAIDVLRFVLNDEIEEVTAFSQNLFIPCNGEDTISLVLKFRKGAYGAVTTSGALPHARNGIEIYGEKGALVTDGSVWMAVRSADIHVLTNGQWETRRGEKNNCYVAEIEDFLGCVGSGARPKVGGEEGKKNIQVVLQCYRSMDEKRTLRIEA
jgi:predicted dehydrogenase